MDCSQIPDALKEATGCGSSSGDLSGSIQTILNSIIGAAGIVAVIFIVIGGINYMTSGGDTGKLKKAKDTILYATIGLIICALSFAIVNWVIGAMSGSNDSQTDNSSGTAVIITEQNPIAFLQK